MSDEDTVVRLLRARNRAGAAACNAIRHAESLLADCMTLEAQCAEQKQRTDLLQKEQHEMKADLQLLRENEANAGVSREHIELLQEQLQKSKSEAAEAAAAMAAGAKATEAAQLMVEELGEAREKVANLEHSLKQVSASEVALKAENARLIERLTEQLNAQARAMDSEVEQHELRLQAEAAAKAASAVPDVS